MAPTCHISGNSDMYGLGIRIGFYLQWLSAPIVPLIAPKETSSLQTSHAFFVSITFLGLVIETLLKDLDVVEIYIVLLLATGSQYINLVVWLWRIATRFEARLDPTMFVKTPHPSRTFWLFNSLVQLAAISFQLWFWIYKIPRVKLECWRFGFGFSKIDLESENFRIFNIVLMTALLALTLAFFGLHLQRLWKEDQLPLLPNASVMPPPSRPSTKTSLESVPEVHKSILASISTVFRMASIGIVILAIELTLVWNEVQDVDNTKTIGQLIPLMLSVGGVLHLLLAAKRHYDTGKPGSEKLSNVLEQGLVNIAIFGVGVGEANEDVGNPSPYSGFF